MLLNNVNDHVTNGDIDRSSEGNGIGVARVELVDKSL